eukprot:2251472-Rhodomonas_salina.2
MLADAAVTTQPSWGRKAKKRQACLRGRMCSSTKSTPAVVTSTRGIAPCKEFLFRLSTDT